MGSAGGAARQGVWGNRERSEGRVGRHDETLRCIPQRQRAIPLENKYNKNKYVERTLKSHFNIPH